MVTFHLIAQSCLMPHLYRRYVDDTLVRMPSSDAAAMFLATLGVGSISAALSCLVFPPREGGGARAPFPNSGR